MSSGPSPRSTRRRPRPHRSTRPVALAAALILGLTTIACSSDGPDEPSATVPTVPTTKAGTTTEPGATTTTAAPTVEEQVEAAYLEANAAFFSAARTADPDASAVAATHSGPVLDLTLQILNGFRRDGVHAEYVDDQFPVPTVETVELIGDKSAKVTFCLVDNSRQIEDAGGKTVDDDVTSRRGRAEMRLIDGAWRLYAQEGIAEWSDGGGCNR